MSNPFKSDSELSKSNNPFDDQHRSDLDLNKPALPPRPRQASAQAAPPLPNRPSPSRSNYELNISPPRHLEKTLSHQSSFERFSNLKLKELVSHPDTFNPNIKPPVDTMHQHSVQHKGHVKAMAISGKFIVTVSQNVRIWYIQTGDNIKTIPLQDIKPTCVAFVPSFGINDEDTLIWIGTDKGELLEISLLESRITDKRALHSSSINFILRYRHTQLVTIDEQGALKIWSERDESKKLGLNGRPRGLRVNLKLNVAHIADDYLWMASGRTVEIYNLTPHAPSVLLKKLDLGSTIGNVARFASNRLQDNIIMYSGHDDGKVIEWNSVSFEKIRIIQTGIYRVSSLFSVYPRFVWVGYTTGKISVFDFGKEPPVLIKEFTAHSNSAVEELSLNEQTVLSEYRYSIASMSDLGEIRWWDGWLRQDWIDNYVNQRQEQYCVFDNVNILVCSWNIDSRKPIDLDTGMIQDSKFIEEWVSACNDPDIIIFGFQELVDLESVIIIRLMSQKTGAAKSFLNLKASKPENTLNDRMFLWQDHLQKSLNRAFPKSEFQMMECQQLIGLFQCIFGKKSMASRVSNIEYNTTKTGLGGFHGNKGGIATRFTLNDSSFAFVNVHLAAHQSQTSARNNDISTILQDTSFKAGTSEFAFVRGGDGSHLLDHEYVFFSGDMNYRIDLPRPKVIDLISKNAWSELHEYDQLLVQKKLNTKFGLRAFLEGPLEFAPTFKYDRGSSNYDTSEKMRVPAWCDRILFKGNGIELQTYQRFENLMSDHRPIAGCFKVKCKSIKKPQYMTLYEQAIDQEKKIWQANLQNYSATRSSQFYNISFTEAYNTS